MKKVLVAFVLVMLVFSGCTKEAEIEMMTGTRTEIAAQYIADMESKDLKRLLGAYNYSPEMQQAMNETLWIGIYADMQSKFGTWVETQDYVEVEQSGYNIVAYEVAFSDKRATVNIVFGADDAIAGINYLEKAAAVSLPADAQEVEVTIGEDFPLDGTLTLPAGEGPFPCVILIQGSGPSDRDETVLENKPFRDIAYGLAEQGVASYRFDKRTFVHGASIDSATFTVFEESVEDATFALAAMLEQDAINANQIYIAGHSLGGYLIPRIAAVTPTAAGYVSLAGSVTPLAELIVEQINYIARLDGTVAPDEQAQIDAVTEMYHSITNLTADSNLTAQELLGADKAYWLDLQPYRPHVQARDEITKPFLLMQGSRDYQVPVHEFDLWKSELMLKDNVTFKLYDGLNHLLYWGEGPSSPEEYYTPGHVDSQLIKDMADWIKEQ